MTAAAILAVVTVMLWFMPDRLWRHG